MTSQKPRFSYVRPSPLLLLVVFPICKMFASLRVGGRISMPRSMESSKILIEIYHFEDGVDMATSETKVGGLHDEKSPA